MSPQRQGAPALQPRFEPESATRVAPLFHRRDVRACSLVQLESSRHEPWRMTIPLAFLEIISSEHPLALSTLQAALSYLPPSLQAKLVPRRHI
jgi:hypothetical protein